MAGRPNLSITSKIRGKWDCVNFSSEENHPRLCEFSWPAKNYSCSFCKRQFKSAQALGGHMNVHRRDRARLRLLRCSTLPESPNPNPNPDFSSVSSSPSVLATVELSSNHNKPHFLLSPSTCLSLTPQDKEKKFVLEFPQSNSKKALPLAKEDEFKTMKTENIMSLDLERVVSKIERRMWIWSFDLGMFSLLYYFHEII